MRTTFLGPRPLRVAGLCGLALSLVLSAPAPAPGREPTAPPLARYAPKDDLILYAEFAGLDAHEAAWKATAAYKLLNETKLGALLEDLIGQLAKTGAAGAQKVPELSPAETGTLVRHVMRNGFVLAVAGKPPGNPQIVFALRGAAGKEVRALFARLLGPAGGTDAKMVVKGTRKVIAVTPAQGQPWAWWPEKDDLIIAPPGSDLDAILATIDGKRPNAVDHPLRAKLARVDDGFQPIGLAFLDVTALPPLPPQAAELGLAGLKQVDYRWGFQADAMMSVFRFVAPSPRKGILALFDGPTFDVKGVPAVPAGVTGFTVASVDFGKLYDQVVALAKSANPQAGVQVGAAEKAASQRLGGLRLREDLLAHLGPKLGLYARAGTPPKGNGDNDPPPPGMMMPGMGAIPDVVLHIQVDNPAAFGKTLDTLMVELNKALKAGPPAGPPRPPGMTPKAVPGRPGPGGPAPEFKKVAGPGMTYALALPPGALPPGPMAAIKPTITLGKSSLVIATTAEAAAGALTAEAQAGWSPGADQRAMVERLPKRMTFLSVSDPRDSMPELIAGLPMLVPMISMQAQAARGGRPGGAPPIQIDPAKVPRADEIRSRLFPGSFAMAVDDQDIRFVSRSAVPSLTSPGGIAAGGVGVALLLPAVQAAREAARRAQCSNNLKQIGLALHNYHAANKEHFPPATLAGKDGKPLLSWRVAILPYLEEGPLYKQFKLDEPWDSPNNLKLIQSMPKAYACPSVAAAQPGMTTYRAVSGKGAGFEGTKTTGIRDFIDGTSMTLLVVESTEAVPWTKPDDLAPGTDPAAPLPGVGSPHRSQGPPAGGFNALFADGAVRFLKATIDPKTLRALTTRGGKEVVNPGSF